MLLFLNLIFQVFHLKHSFLKNTNKKGIVKIKTKQNIMSENAQSKIIIKINTLIYNEIKVKLLVLYLKIQFT